MSALRHLMLALIVGATTSPAMPRPVADEVPAEAETVLPFIPPSDRMTVGVSIDQSGPHPFVVDTGAERSVISRQLAQALRLDTGPTVRLVSMGGVDRVGTVRVPSIAIGRIRDNRGFHAPALEQTHLGAHGLLGIEQLRGRVLAIDFDRNEMLLRTGSAFAPAPRAEIDEIVVEARSKSGQLIITDAQYDKTRITVVIDTGSAVSLGNTALMHRLRETEAAGVVTLMDVTGRTLTANYRIARRVRLGGLALQQLPVAFADVAPFRRFGLANKPALLLGMDSLKLFRRVEIDFARREIRFEPRTPLARGG